MQTNQYSTIEVGSGRNQTCKAHVKHLVNSNQWKRLGALFDFEPVFHEGMPHTIDWRHVPKPLMDILQEKSPPKVLRSRPPQKPAWTAPENYSKLVVKRAGLHFDVYFDGGYSNHKGYGSWEVEHNGFKKRVQEQFYRKSDYDVTMTNNVAEWLALIGALQWLQSVRDKSLYTLSIHGDSQLVIRQLSGVYRCKSAAMALMRDDAVGFLTGWESWSAHWNNRSHSVKRFGH